MAMIKLDLTANELVVLAPVERRVNHIYSDEPAEGIIARCYTFTARTCRQHPHPRPRCTVY
jgi:hypothetical protein